MIVTDTGAQIAKAAFRMGPALARKNTKAINAQIATMDITMPMMGNVSVSLGINDITQFIQFYSDTSKSCNVWHKSAPWHWLHFSIQDI